MFRDRFGHLVMTWKEFEIHCGNLIRKFIQNKDYRLEEQYRRQYPSGELVMDFHLAETRPGGRGFVLDCKHFPLSPLNHNEINTTLNYKRKCRASKAFMLISSQSMCSPTFLNNARARGIDVEVVDIRNYPWILGLMRQRLQLNLP